MKKFLKEYLGLIATIGLASWSIFAFTISTSIDNALQVIKTIRVTSDGTTTNPPFMTMDGSGKYVSIGTTGTGDTVNISWSFFAKHNETILFAGNDATNALGYPIAGTMMGIDGRISSQSIAQVVTYDTTHIDPSGQVWVNVETQWAIGITWSEAHASINTSNGDRMDIHVEQWMDYTNYYANGNSGIVLSHNRAEVNMDPDNVHLLAQTGVQRVVDNGNVLQTNYIHGTDLQIYPTHIQMYTSGWFADMWFDGIKWLFGFAKNNPWNTIDIWGSYITGTLWLRFSSRQNASWQILGINNSGDVVTLGNINSFGGGWNPWPWQYGAGSPQSAQIMWAGNSALWWYSVVGWVSNIVYGFISSILGGTQNVVHWTGSTVVWWGYNKINIGDWSFIGGGQFNEITWQNVLAIAHFIGAGEGNSINTTTGARNFIGAGLDNTITNTDSAFIGAGEHNSISPIAINTSIVGGSGNIASGWLSFIWGWAENIIGGLYATIVGGLANIVYGTHGFIGWWASNVLSIWALYSFIGGGQNNSVTDRYSSIVGGSGNINQSEKSFIGWGEANNIDLNSWISSIVWGSGNIINSGSIHSIIGGWFGNIIQNSINPGGNAILWWWWNIINYGIAATVVWGYNNEALGGGGMFVGGGSNNHADGDGMVVVWGSHNWAGAISGNATQSFIGWGSDNTTIDSSRTVIVWWSENRIEENASHSSILGGFKNTITSSLLAWIGGGSGNTITASGDYTSIWGGFNNIVDNAPASFIGWGHDNTIMAWWPASIEYPNTIAGGSHNSALWILNTIAWGYHNTADGTLYTIGWGNENSITADGDGSTIGWWSHNAITGFGYKSVIWGGSDNSITNGSNVVIGGGWFNVISGSDSTIPWWMHNTIDGSNSFAAWQYASALTDDTFVWNSSFTPFSSTIPGTFLINAYAGVGINTNNTNGKSLRVNWSVQANDYYSANNNQGMTTTLTNIGGGGCNMTFENGLLVSTSGC